MSNLLKDNKELMKKYNYKKNKDIDLNTLTIGTGKTIWWICDKGHEWSAKVDSVSRGTGCPYCSGRKRIVGVNDIFTIHPDWKKYWDMKENNKNGINPYSLGCKSHVKVHWICSECGRKFSRDIVKMKDAVLCFDCANIIGKKNKYKNQLLKTGSLISAFPNIAKEWNYNKNKGLRPEDFLPNSNKKVWWKCSKGHEWQASINSRSSDNRGCPICANQKVLKGYNDLATIFPEFLSEWNYEKNKLSPSEIIARTGKKYWWICKQGHEWKMSPLDRTYGRGCPICNSERKISIPEKTVLFYLKKYYKKEIISNYRSEKISNKEIDIYLPKDNLGIEYDGIYFHQDKDRDIEKDKICKKQGIRLLHVAEDKNKNKINNNYIYYKIGKEENLEWAINILLGKILEVDKTYDIDIKRDRTEIYNLIDYYEKEQSLLEKYPEIAREWNYDKNGKLKPEFVSCGSTKKIWWKCSKCDNEWEAAIYSRVAGSGCPFCSGNRVRKGENDLLSLYPLIAAEWHPTKNGDLTPDKVAIKSNKKVWWLAKCGHEWETSIILRIGGNNCPYCGNQKLLKGFNDLKTKNPEIAKEWHPTKNGALKPENVINGSHKKVWWLGKCGHEWKAVIGDRTNGGNSCPFCANNKLLVGFNDLKTKNPELVKEWHTIKNGKLKPEDFFPNSHVKVWWICPNGHEYEAYIIHRNNGTGCPVCKGKLIIKGINDLETINPTLAKYWDIKKNIIKPFEIGVGSGKKYWWKCPKCGNQWYGRVVDVAKKKYICSKCKNN